MRRSLWILTLAIVAVALWIATGCNPGVARDQSSGSSSSAPTDSSAVGATKSEPMDDDRAARSVTNSIGMKLVLVPAGEFMMGSKETEKELEKAFECEEEVGLFSDEYPRHKVKITKPFYLGAYHVTVAQFRQFIVATGYKTEADKGIMRSEKGAAAIAWERDGGHYTEINWRCPGYPQTDEHPVVMVSWDDAVACCKWLSAKEGKTYRLPTEAEWEYACRAGTETRYYFGDDPEKMVKYGNVADATLIEKYPDWRPQLGLVYFGNAISARDGYAICAPVGRFKPNAWGLYDMHGNVWQWCADGDQWDYYKRSPVEDPTGPPDERYYRVLRGGCFDGLAVHARSAAREHLPWYSPRYNIGFRVVRNP